MSKEPLVVIGIGLEGLDALAPEARNHLARAEILAGAKRHLAYCSLFQGTRIELGADLAGWIDNLQSRDREKRTVVLASGDPLFYGIGRALLEAFPKAELLFFPQVSSVAHAFARLKETWQDACVISVHGRPLLNLAPALERREPKIALLTDANNHPAAIARMLRGKRLADQYDLWVCENLGGEGERVSQWSPEDMREEVFCALNVVILLAKARTSPVAEARVSDHGRTLPLLGLPESAILHRGTKGGLITKCEVRLQAIGYLELQPGNVVWDVGAGSGSVSLEAARLSAKLAIYAIEKNTEHLFDNLRRFDLPNIHPIAGEAPEILGSIPDPDAVFIGGSGGRLMGILEEATRRLKPGGRMVLSCITLETQSQAWTWLADRRMSPRATSIQIAHSRPLGNLHCMEPEHPIFLIRATKP